MSFSSEERRIREAYARRDEAGKGRLADARRPEIRIWKERRLEVAASMLAQRPPAAAAGGTGAAPDPGTTGPASRPDRAPAAPDLSGTRCLDVGCGAGDWLTTLRDWGAAPAALHGVDLLEDRIEAARAALPGADLRVGSGWALPFADASMDLVTANTVFSSILDPEARRALAGEMLRVLAPGGLVLVYDFWVSHPRNPDTVGVSRREVLRLFPSCSVTTRRLTLAPPLARPLARVWPAAARLLERAAPLLCTHALHRIVRKTEG